MNTVFGLPVDGPDFFGEMEIRQVAAIIYRERKNNSYDIIMSRLHMTVKTALVYDMYLLITKLFII